MLVLSAMSGTTGWHYSITRHARYAPHVSNYAAGAAGRTFPSAAQQPDESLGVAAVGLDPIARGARNL